MAKRIATQLANEIEAEILYAEDDGDESLVIGISVARRWFDWAKRIDARMRIDGSELSKQRRPKKAILNP